MRDVTLQGRQLGTVGPHRRGPDEQAGVVDSLERELNPPVVRLGGHGRATATLPAPGRTRFVIDILLVAGPVAGRSPASSPSLSSPTAGGWMRKQVRTASAAVSAVACQARSASASDSPSAAGTSRTSAMPGPAAPTGEARAASQASTASPPGGRRRRAGGGSAGRGLVGGRSARKRRVERVGHAPHVGAHDVGRCRRVRPRAGPEALVGHAGTREGRRKVPAEGLDAPTVVAVHQRTPPGPPTGGGALQIGQDATPGDQLEDQVGGPRGETEVRGEGDIRLPCDHRAPRVRAHRGRRPDAPRRPVGGQVPAPSTPAGVRRTPVTVTSPGRRGVRARPRAAEKRWGRPRPQAAGGGGRPRPP